MTGKAVVESMDILATVVGIDLDEETGKTYLHVQCVGRMPQGRRAVAGFGVEWTWPATNTARQALKQAARDQARAALAGALGLEGPPTQGRFDVVELLG